MKAYVLHGIADFRLETASDPVPAANDVIVRVEAAGICGSDIPRIYHTGAYHHPLIPGHEFSGTVVECGELAGTKWLHKRVGVFPLIPCGDCGPCREKQYEMCRHYGYLGSRRDGAFAEYVAVPQWNLIELPEEVGFEEAAMLEPMAVAVHAMRRIAPKPDEKVVICGLGTIGHLLLMFLKDAGVEGLLAIGNKEFQCHKAVDLGIDRECVCNSRQQDAEAWLMEKTNGKGADVFFECVGRNETVRLSIAGAAPGGRVMLVGNPHSDMTLDKNIYWKLLRNQLTVMGTWNSSFTHDADDDWHYALGRLAQGHVEPSKLITHMYDMGSFKRGFEIMRGKTEDYIKVMSAPYTPDRR